MRKKEIVSTPYRPTSKRDKKFFLRFVVQSILDNCGYVQLDRLSFEQKNALAEWIKWMCPEDLVRGVQNIHDLGVANPNIPGLQIRDDYYDLEDEYNRIGLGLTKSEIAEYKEIYGIEGGVCGS